MSEKVRAAHVGRRAVVYLRQSTLKQVINHGESTRRQYGLRDRALEPGWAGDMVDVIDEDLGRSGTSFSKRSGFQKLSEEVAGGRIGGVFALEMSRLARSSADWHRLLELCGVADVVIVDEQMVYDPNDHNDRLLLGIKGTLSEAESVWIRLRLRGARVSKARRGEYRISTPIGYEWDAATSRFRLDPDSEVQSALNLLFERFRQERSAYGVMRYFSDHGLRIPARAHRTRELNWREPRPSRILAILHNPTYAGAYVYGRREDRVDIKEGRVVRSSVRVGLDSWKIVHQERHPAYISWEEFVENQDILRGNRPHREKPEHHGAARKGEALLQGIVLCGRCGRRMNAVYGGKTRRPRYSCASPVQRGECKRICWSVSAIGIDKFIEEQFLDAVTPSEIELSFVVLREAEQQAAKVDNQWRLRLDRARYELGLAERRYKAVDPDNRIVARTLECEWEEKLAELARLEDEHGRARRAKRVDLGDKDRERILQLSRNLPDVWSSSSMSPSDRKSMLRILVGEVSLTPSTEEVGATNIAILWCTGAVTRLMVPRQRPGGHETDPKAVSLIRNLVAQMTPAVRIARRLNADGFQTGKGRAWSKAAVHSYCAHHDIKWPEPMPTSLPVPAQREDGAYSIRGVAAEVGVGEATIRYWITLGYIEGVEGGGRGRAWWFKLDRPTRKRLQALKKKHAKPRR